eukprot:GFKZ01004044.1.p1 GENE.GFKZ01004044.1~~GFKZ01004044.1.p1  ORF type:complete len:533 (+),score=100.50 GFKZ01004044.1:258-1856(+)
MVQAQPEELPIDIDYAKFLPWLIDRRRVPRDWHTHLKSARSLLRHAINSTPPAARSTLKLTPPSPLTPPLSYFQVLDVLNALTAADAPPTWQAGAEKDLLGRYKGPTSRAWAAVVAAFEHKYAYLADCAQALTRNADVEAPAMKQAIARLQRDAAELVRRDAPAVRAAAEAKERFQVACAEFELPPDGDPDYYQLLEMEVDRRVPVLLREAVRCVKTDVFVEALAYYAGFSEYVRGDGSAGDLCPTVRKVMEGDIDELVRSVRREVELATGGDGVDWDIEFSSHEPGSDATPVEIDWGIEIDASGVADITADAVQEEEGNGGEEARESPIDWNETADSLEGSGGEELVDTGDVSSKPPTLADPAFREMFLNDLIELDAFLAQRAAEATRFGDTDTGLIMQQATGTPNPIKAVDTQKIGALQEAVGMAMSAINSADTRRMLALQSDSKRLDRAARAILEKKHVAERSHAAIDVLRKRRSKAQEDLATELPKLAELEVVTRDIKRRTEVALSALYKGRTVNILGEINNIFPNGE